MKHPIYHRRVVIDGYTIKVACRIKSKQAPVYYAVYTRPDKERTRYLLGVRDPDEAREALDKYISGAGFKADVRAGIASLDESRADERDLSLTKLREYYVDVYLVNQFSGPRVLTNVRVVLDEFVAFAHGRGIRRCSHLTRPLVDAYAAMLRKRQLAPKTILNNLTTLRAALNAAFNAEMIPANPIRKWALPTVPDPEIEPLSTIELAELLRIVERDRPDAYPIIAWIALTGNRPSDACDLRFRQVDLKHNIVSRTQVKVKKLAKYDVSPAAAALVAAEKLRRRPGPDERVFLHMRDKKPWTERALWHVLSKTLTKAKFRRNVNLKDLRHTFGYLMANDPAIDCKIQKLRVLMGHSDIRMTLRYVKSDDAKAEVSRLGDALKLTKPRKR